MKRRNTKDYNTKFHKNKKFKLITSKKDRKTKELEEERKQNDDSKSTRNSKDDDIILNDEDIDFFEADTDTHFVGGKLSENMEEEDSEEEVDDVDRYYRSRISKQKSKESNTNYTHIDENDDDEDDDEDDVDDADDDGDDADVGSDPELDILANKIIESRYSKEEIEQQLEMKKQSISQLCEKIIVDPHNSFKKIGDQQPLFNTLVNYLEDKNYDIVKITLLSICVVFEQILPSYTITNIKDEKQKLSKEVSNQRNYEGLLLKSYRKLLLYLSTYLSQLPPPGEIIKNHIIYTSMKCIESLVKTKLYWNESSTLIQLLLKSVQNKNRIIREYSCEILKSIFKFDRIGQKSVEILEAIEKTLKSRNCRVFPEIIECTRKLPIHVKLEDGQALIKNKVKRNKNKVKKLIENSTADTDHNKFESNQKQSLRVIILIYIRLLKSTNYQLLPLTIELLSDYIPLINIDIVVDLIKYFKDILNNPKLIFSVHLLSTFILIDILNGVGKTLNIDDSPYISKLYELLTKLTYPMNKKYIGTTLDILYKSFIMRYELNQPLIFSILKKLEVLCLYYPTYISMLIIYIIFKIIKKYNNTTIMLENELDRVQKGLYNYYLNNPLNNNSDNTSLWGMTELYSSYNLSLSKLIKELLNSNNGNASISSNITFLSNTNYNGYINYYNNIKLGFYNAPPPPKPHPLDSKLVENKLLFISPPKI